MTIVCMLAVGIKMGVYQKNDLLYTCNLWRSVILWIDRPIVLQR